MKPEAPAATADLVGHGWALDLLARSIERGRPSHAYLITGLPHVGKFSVALAMAQQLLCAAVPACGHCRHCSLATRRVHPDLRVLELPPERRNIPLRDVHEFMQGIALRPLEATRKVYVVRGAEDLAEEGANALLKTLEEPPPAVTIILTAPDPAGLLPTVVSRCQRIALHPVPPSEIAAHLVGRYEIDDDRADAIARASGGRPGWAILAAQHPGLMDERQTHARQLLDLLGADRLQRLQAADSLADRWTAHQDEVRGVLEAWTDVWRDALFVQEGVDDRVRSSELLPELRHTVSQLSAAGVQHALAFTLETADSLERNAHPRLALEAYTLLLPRLVAGRG